MLEKVIIKNFKKFSSATFNLKPSGITYLAGGNNSGKSTFLQALAVWEFCKTVLQMEKGPRSILAGFKGQGLGISDDEFNPVAVANLKHFWTNLKTFDPKVANGYSLSIECEWKDDQGNVKRLGFAMALANDRLFIKPHNSNLADGDVAPQITYLPPFAGMDAKEKLMSPADRRSMIGRGLAGAIIRNAIFDMFKSNEEKRALLKADRTKIKGSDLKKLRETDSWEILQDYLGKTYNLQLAVNPFNELYHTHINVEAIKGEFEGKTFKKFPNYKKRDLMSEGSGFLQMLSVYTLALSENFRIILLDEPDAHLHVSLQKQLMDRLTDAASTGNKQMILATHSTEILRHADYSDIMQFKGTAAKYLNEEDQKIGLFLGLGSDFSPKLDPLRKGRRLLIVENRSDERLIRKWFAALDKKFPENVVVWPWPSRSKERKVLFGQLKSEIPDLKAISIVERDAMDIEKVDKITLADKDCVSGDANLHLRVWRRRHVENYLMHPEAISRASGISLEDVNGILAAHALVVGHEFASRDAPKALLDAHGKDVIRVGANAVCVKGNISAEQLAENMKPEEIAEDVKTLVDQIINLAS